MGAFCMLQCRNCASGQIVEISLVKEEIQSRYGELGKKGFRVLGVCYKFMEHLVGPLAKRMRSA